MKKYQYLSLKEREKVFKCLKKSLSIKKNNQKIESSPFRITIKEKKIGIITQMKLQLILVLFINLNLFSVTSSAKTNLNQLLKAVNGKWYGATDKKELPHKKFSIKFILMININEYSRYEMEKPRQYKQHTPLHLVTGVFTADMIPKRKPNDKCELLEEFKYPFIGIVEEGKIIFQSEKRISNSYRNLISKLLVGEIRLTNEIKKGKLNLSLSMFNIGRRHIQKSNIVFTRNKPSLKSKHN